MPQTSTLSTDFFLFLFRLLFSRFRLSWTVEQVKLQTRADYEVAEYILQCGWSFLMVIRQVPLEFAVYMGFCPMLLYFQSVCFGYSLLYTIFERLSRGNQCCSIALAFSPWLSPPIKLVFHFSYMELDFIMDCAIFFCHCQVVSVLSILDSLCTCKDCCTSPSSCDDRPCFTSSKLD